MTPNMCTRPNKGRANAGTPCRRPQFAWPPDAPLPDPHSCKVHLTAQERAAIGEPARAAVPSGGQVAVYFSGDLLERRKYIRAMTGYPDSAVYQRGAEAIEAELKAIETEAETRRHTCQCRQRYPSGHCRRCYGWQDPAAVRPPAYRVPKISDTPTGALFRSVKT